MPHANSKSTAQATHSRDSTKRFSLNVATFSNSDACSANGGKSELEFINDCGKK